MIVVVQRKCYTARAVALPAWKQKAEHSMGNHFFFIYVYRKTKVKALRGFNETERGVGQLEWVLV